MSRVIAVMAKSARAVVSAGMRGGKGDPGAIGPAFKVDATGPTSDRSLYDASPEGFSFLDTTTGLLYFRQGAGWSAGTQFQGPQGIQGPPGPPGAGSGGAPIISSDPNNRLTQGTDSGLYVRDDLTPDPLAYYILARS